MVNNNKMGAGIAVGVAIGVALGAAWSSAAEKQKSDDPE